MPLDGIYPRIIALLGCDSVQSMSTDRTIAFAFFRAPSLPQLREIIWNLLHRAASKGACSPVLAFVLKRLFLALDYYLPAECQIIRTEMSSFVFSQIVSLLGSESLWLF